MKDMPKSTMRKLPLQPELAIEIIITPLTQTIFFMYEKWHEQPANGMSECVGAMEGESPHKNNLHFTALHIDGTQLLSVASPLIDY